jgi:hypothetical protein
MMVKNKTTSPESTPEEKALAQKPPRGSVVSPPPAAKTVSGQARIQSRIAEARQPTITNAADILRDIARVFAEKHETSADALLTNALEAERKAVHPK